MIPSLSRLRRWFALPILPEQYRYRPRLEGLEDRLAPAFDLTISTGVTNLAVTVTDTGITLRTFEATATGANVDVDDIKAALDAGFNVVVTTGSTGAEDGDLTWNNGANLTFDAPLGNRDLDLVTSGLSGDIVLNGVNIATSLLYNADLDLSLSGAADIDVLYLGGELELASLTVTTTGGDVSIDVQVNATDGVTVDASGNITINAEMDVDVGNIDLDATGDVVLNDDLSVYTGDILLDGTNVTVTGFYSLDVEVGDVAVTAATAISLYNVFVEDGDITLTAPTVNLDGDLDVEDFGNILVTGDLTLLSGATLAIGYIDPNPYYYDSSFGGGNITITGDIEGTSSDSLGIETADGTVTLGGAVGAGLQVADLDIDATNISLNGDINLVESGNGMFLSLRGDVITTGNRVFSLSAPLYYTGVTFDGAVTLGGTLDINLENVTDNVNIEGDFAAGANNVTTNGNVDIDGNFDEPAVFSGSGILTAASVIVDDDGAIAPIGTLDIAAAQVMFFFDSRLLIDLAGTPDQLIVSGDVDIFSATIDGTGSLASAGPFTVLTATDIGGTFQGTAGSVPFLLGNEAVTATYTATTMAITRAAGGANTQKKVDASGAFYTVKLTGGGGAELIVVDDPDSFGIEGILVRNATTANKLTITVTPNGGSTVIDLDILRIGGSIGLVKAPFIEMDGELTVSGYLKSATFFEVFGDVTLGGTAGQKTALKANFFFDVDLTMTSKLNSLTGNEFFGSITAPSIGSVTMKKAAGGDGDFEADLDIGTSSTTTALSSVNAAGDVSGDWDILGKVGTVTVKEDVFNWELGTNIADFGGVNKITVTGGVFGADINTFGRIGTLTVGEWEFGDITAGSIGTIKSVGSNAFGLTGDWEGDVTVTGSANPGQVALKTFSVKGEVFDSTFDIQAGNVTSFVVGKFIDSSLLLGFTGAFDTGTFGANNFKLGTFKTTALPFTPGVVDDATVAFDNSFVVAARFGTVRLSSVETSNFQDFGLRVAANTPANVGSVRVATFVNPNTNLQPQVAALADDFFFLALA